MIWGKENALYHMICKFQMKWISFHMPKGLTAWLILTRIQQRLHEEVNLTNSVKIV